MLIGSFEKRKCQLMRDDSLEILFTKQLKKSYELGSFLHHTLKFSMELLSIYIIL